jgi:argininosuccinate lyase
MEYLIQKGIPQRTGHEIVGKLVALCERRGCRLADLTSEDFAAAHPSIGEDVRETLGVANAVRAFRSYGSTAPGEVARQVTAWRERLK